MLHVGLNLVFLTPGEQGGMEVYARELLPRLAARGDLRLTAFVNRDGAGGRVVDPAWGIDEVVVGVRASDRRQWVLGEQLHLPRMAKAAGCELVHSLASTAPLHGRFRRITTIHDLNYKIVPETHFGILGLGMRVLVPAAAHRSHRLIAVSSSTADDLVAHLKVPRAKIDVVPQGVSARPAVAPTPEAELRARLELGDRPVLLTVSAKRPHKNLPRLIEAHAGLPAPRPVLVLPGYPTPHEAELRALADRLGTLGELRFLDWVSDADLEGLYALAAVFAFPSLYEGFGLPPLEAMSRGVPVVTSARGSLAEVVGDAAAVVDPESVPAIRDAIARLLADAGERERLRAAGRVQAARFTWERTAELTAAAYGRAGVR
ncbi:MAG TPA: glycosyltransferase family 1 protein [Baekduia sp.]|nr:glycosyltransferase family 1 protein [Baekduia sp.]